MKVRIILLALLATLSVNAISESFTMRKIRSCSKINCYTGPELKISTSSMKEFSYDDKRGYNNTYIIQCPDGNYYTNTYLRKNTRGKSTIYQGDFVIPNFKLSEAVKDIKKMYCPGGRDYSKSPDVTKFECHDTGKCVCASKSCYETFYFGAEESW